MHKRVVAIALECLVEGRIFRAASQGVVECSLSVLPAVNGDLVTTLGDRGSEERNWSLYLIIPMDQSPM